MKRLKKVPAPQPKLEPINHKLSIQMQFFKMLKTKEAVAFYKLMVKKDKLIKYVNLQHLLEPISVQELKQMTGRNGLDG